MGISASPSDLPEHIPSFSDHLDFCDGFQRGGRSEEGGDGTAEEGRDQEKFYRAYMKPDFRSHCQKNLARSPCESALPHAAVKSKDLSLGSSPSCVLYFLHALFLVYSGLSGLHRAALCEVQTDQEIK